MTVTTTIETQRVGVGGATVNAGSEPLRRLQRLLLEKTTTAENKLDALGGIANVLAEYAQPVAIFHVEHGEEDQLAAPLQIHPSGAEACSDQLTKQLIAACEAAC